MHEGEPIETSGDDALRKARVQRLARLARWLDTAVTIPGTPIKFGADAVLGLIPIVGDFVTAGLALYIIIEGWRLGASWKTVAKMVGNVAVDFLLSELVVLGDIADIFFRANKRNIALLAKDLNMPELVPEAYRETTTEAGVGVKRVDNEAAASSARA